MSNKMESFKNLFKSSTKDGELNNCQELTPDGKKFAVRIIHLLESQSDVTETQIINKIKTWNYLEGKKDVFKISQSRVMEILRDWKTDVSLSRNTKKSAISEENKCFVRTQCGKHSLGVLAKNLSIPKSTLHDWAKSEKLIPFKKQTEVACHICQLLNPECENLDLLVKTIFAPNPPGKKELTEGSKEFVRNQCGYHAMSKMSKILSVPKTTLYDWIQKEKLYPFEKKTDGLCHFYELDTKSCKGIENSTDISSKESKSEETLPVKSAPSTISQSNQDFVKNQCGVHSSTSMALLLKIPKTTLYKWVIQNGLYPFIRKTVKLLGDTDCHFCHLEESKKRKLLDDMNNNKSPSIETTPLAKKQKLTCDTPKSSFAQRKPGKALFQATTPLSSDSVQPIPMTPTSSSLPSMNDSTLKGSRTPMFFSSSSTMLRRTQPGLDEIKAIAAREDTSPLEVICCLGSRYCNSKEGGYNKRYGALFQQLADGESFGTKYIKRIPNEIMTNIKFNTALSKTDYELIRYQMKPFVEMAEYDVLSQHEKPLFPEPKPFIDSNGKAIGQAIPLITVAKDTVLDILNHHYGKHGTMGTVDDLPTKLYMYGGIGGGKKLIYLLTNLYLLGFI